MPKKCFLSFHYKPDNWRVSQIKQLGVIEGQPLMKPNEWEAVKGRGQQAIKDWIEANMKGKDCLIVLVGENTAGRKWVNHEVVEAWKKGMGVFGIYIHNLKNSDGYKSGKGLNPFATFNINGTPFTTWAKMYDPPSADSSAVYNHISDNLNGWIDAAIKLRKSA